MTDTTRCCIACGRNDDTLLPLYAERSPDDAVPVAWVHKGCLTPSDDAFETAGAHSLQEAFEKSKARSAAKKRTKRS